MARSFEPATPTGDVAIEVKAPPSNPDNLRGALWILAAGAISAGMVYFVRLAAESVPTTEIAFLRGALGALLVLPIVARTGLSALKSKQVPLLVARGINGSLVLALAFYTMSVLPLAQLTSISFSRPLFVLLLAAAFLGERLRLYRSTATLVGFVGILIIVRPSADMHPASLLALLTAALIAVNLILVKLLTRTDRTETLVFYSALIQGVLLAIPAAIVWVTPTWEAFGYVIGVTVCGTLMQTCVVRAYRIAEAAAIAPFDYSRLLFAGALGYFVFAEVPDEWTGVGAVIVIASTLYIARREVKIAQEAKSRQGGSTPL